MHIRRTDMLDGCPDYAKPWSVFPCPFLGAHRACSVPLTSTSPPSFFASYATAHYAAHLASIRSRLPAAAASWPVLVTTDETSPVYLAEIAALGWTVMDHVALGTREEYGVWYPNLVDNVVLSFGRGFVGTGSSTSECAEVGLVV